MKHRYIILSIVLFALIFTGTALAKTTFISIGTGGTGGIYYPYGGGVAEIWSKHVDGIKAVAEVTGASVENVKLAHKGETVIGEVMGDVAVAGYNGLSKFKGKKHDILSMAIMYPNLLQIVALKKSGINNIEAVKGKNISTGSPGSGTNFMAEAVLNALEIPLTSFKDSRLSFTESANALRDGTIKIGVWSVGPGTSSILDLSTTHDINILPFTPGQTQKILASKSTYASVELAGGIYRGVDAPVSTIGVWNVMICQKSLDTDLVYKLVKVLFENNAYLQKIHPSAAYTTPENTVKYSSIPLHPGTIKYLKEKGVDVPSRLIPLRKNNMTRPSSIIFFCMLGLVFLLIVTAWFVPGELELRITLVKENKIILSLPLKPEERFTIRYIHSVENAPIWETHSMDKNGTIYIEEEKYEKFGAGMGKMPGVGRMVTEGIYEVIKDMHMPTGNFILRVGSPGVDHTLIWRDRQVNFSDTIAHKAVRFSGTPRSMLYNLWRSIWNPAQEKGSKG